MASLRILATQLDFNEVFLMWYIYILKCNDGRFYTGITSNLKRRFKEHKRGRGGRFTRSFGVNKLLYQEKCFTRPQALKREAQIKSWPKRRKITLIKSGFELAKDS